MRSLGFIILAAILAWTWVSAGAETTTPLPVEGVDYRLDDRLGVVPPVARTDHTWLWWMPVLVVALGAMLLYRQVELSRLARRLDATRKAAREVQEAKLELLADLGQQLHAPLNALVSLTYLALKSGNAEQVRSCLKGIESSAFSLRILINRMLDSAEVPAGQMQAERTAFDLGELLDKVFAVTQPMAKDRGVNLGCQLLDSAPRRVVGDPQRIEQILVAIASNALKLVETGYAVLIVSAETGDADGRRLHFRVKCSGTSRTDVQLRRIFAAFEQTEVAATPQDAMTNLELALAKKYAETMGGVVELRNLSSEGVELAFSMPLVPVLGEPRSVSDPASRPRAPDAAPCTLQDTDFSPDVPAETRRVDAAVIPQGAPARQHRVVVDREAGLRWAAGDAGLYRRLLEEFLRTYRDKLGLLEATRALRQPEEIEKLAHALKSNATAIGAEGLARAAAELEAQIRQNGVPNAERIASLRASLEAVIGVLGEHISDAPREVEDACAPLPREDGRPAILVVDDESFNLLLVKEFLAPEYRICCVNSGAQALEVADGGARPDLILLDIVMPEMDGFEVCRRLKANPSTRDIQVIFLTAKTDAVDEQKGLDLGAIDYIHKPFQRAVLRARVRNHLALKRQGDFFAQLSGIDALTGIANRRRLDEILEREWNRAVRNRHSLALMMIDIDEFKNYNDHYGHDAGDDCLRRVTATMDRLCFRKTDLVARYGGEEFCWVMPETNIDGAKKKARELLQAIGDLGIPHETSTVVGHVTASIGVIAEIPNRGDSLRAFVKRADECLYRAKRSGRNRLVAG